MARVEVSHPEVLDTRFLYYLLQSPEARNHMRGYATGTTVRAVSVADAEALVAGLPPMVEQKAIAHTLGTLDDRIEVHRHMNETLEAMASALFKSWFVDFDPVRAKADGRDPGLPRPLADLFPDSLRDSELGEIPRGWVIWPVRDLASLISRGISPTYLDSGGILVLNQKCIRDRRIDFSKARRHDAVKRSVEDRRLLPFDVLVNSTGVGTLGRIAQVWRLPEEAIVDSHITVVRAANGVAPPFLGMALAARQADIEALGEGSTGQTELSRKRLGELPCVAAPIELQAASSRIVQPIMERVSLNECLSETLADIRDALLPKLISGETRVPPAVLMASATPS